MTLAAILGCSGLRLAADEAAFFRDADPWAFILFARNVESPGQLRALTTALRETVGRDAPIFIDQEGGRVARMAAPHWREWPPARDQARALAPEEARKVMYLRARIIAHELRACGLDGNCAPLADIARKETHPVLLNRCYGDDVDSVVTNARAIAEGCLDGGVLPVLKHIPGHGRATMDSHLDLPRVTEEKAALETTDFAAFRVLADLPLAMTAHIVFETLDADHCATLSKTMNRVIRDEIGFGGLLMTDDVSMHALTGPIGERCSMARAAGCDMILHCNGDRTEMKAVAETAGNLDGKAAERAARALAARHAPAAFDIERAERAYRELWGAHV